MRTEVIFSTEGGLKMPVENIEERAKEMRRQYLKEWRAKNPQKMRQYNENYWRRKVLAMQEKERKEESST